MKKIAFAFLILSFAISTSNYAQTATTTAPPATSTQATANTDFFAGKWEVVFLGTPNGDAKLTATFTRKEGKLEGELLSTADNEKKVIPITNIEEEESKITFYFSAQGYDLNATLEKVDADNLKGQLMNMFESKATRIKE